MTGRSLRRNPAVPWRPGATAAVAGVALLALALPAGGAHAQAAARPAPPPAVAAPPPAAAAPVDVSGLIHVCSSCHGFEGRNNSSSFPNLAGQPKDFLVGELTAMRDHKRSDPHVRTYMWGMAAQLTDPVIAAIANYYSQQAPAPGTPSNSPLVALGRRIFQSGVPANGVPACQSCHGAAAQGNGPFPRLAGQHPEYVSRELAEFASEARVNSVMQPIAHKLTPQEIEAVAAYVSTL